MNHSERIIPFSRKDKHHLLKHLQWQFGLGALYLVAALFILGAFIVSYHHPAFKILAGASIVCFTVMLLLCLFEKRPTFALRLLRDLKLGKKRVIYGRVEQVHYQHPDARPPVQLYNIGPYCFELGQLSPVLKKFRQVMPGQSVEIHQCLHSGLILRLEIMEE